ncbi:MAG: hypothetical protein NC206_05015 [Bacteroides sp.]|nr:hypothetical protein [Roseburia sp.]MCM1346426.1 hypothetical protein [Bacteroides sp.]MCM1420993.1 hypothetical protein [Bacteroides sp.]
MTTIKRYNSAKPASYAASAQSNSNSPKGSIDNPYTLTEFYDYENGAWPGGYVEGLGYVPPDTVIWGSQSSSSDPDSWGSDISDPWGSDTSDLWGSDGSSSNPGNTGGGGGGGTTGGGRPGGTTSGNNTTNKNPVADVLSVSQFRPFQDNEPRGCFRRCQEMLASANCSLNDGEIAMANYDSNGRATTPTSSAPEGISYIESQLNQKHPVIVSVDYKEGTSMGSGKSDQAGDHFVIIVGGCSSEGFHYYDPGTRDSDNGTSPNNMFLYENGLLIDTSVIVGKDYKYIVTGIRTNK